MTEMRTVLEMASMELFLAARGVLFRGSSYECPVCGASLRAFTHGGGSLRVRERGYCPRCNAKARHRRVWLHCRHHTDLFERELRVLHVAPKYCLSRRMVRMHNVDYVAVDLVSGPHVTMIGDITDLKVPDDSFDAILSVHVLEHVDDDRAAIREMWRVLRPGGWAVVNVPLDLDAPTFEDASIVSPEARRRAFGEADHVRVYGRDICDRFRAAGFETTLFTADELDDEVVVRHGLTPDEHIIMCTKPAGGRHD